MGVDIIVLYWPPYLSELLYILIEIFVPNLLKAVKNAKARAVLRIKYYMFSI